MALMFAKSQRWGGHAMLTTCIRAWHFSDAHVPWEGDMTSPDIMLVLNIRRPHLLGLIEGEDSSCSRGPRFLTRVTSVLRSYGFARRFPKTNSRNLASCACVSIHRSSTNASQLSDLYVSASSPKPCPISTWLPSQAKTTGSRPPELPIQITSE